MFVLTFVLILTCSILSVSLVAIAPVSAEIDEYFVYSKFCPNLPYVSGVGGYVEYYGVPEWGDEIQYIYFLSGTTGYKVKVWITDGDGDGKIEPRQHPNHYLEEFRGPIEPRHFEIVSSADLTGYTAGSESHTEEFYVDSSGVYLGAYPYGIHKWDHNWNYIGKIANPPPERTESLAYNPAENVWYAGGRHRTIYELRDTDNDGSFLDENWVAIFTYPDYGGDHHDGLEYVGGYLWISDMTSDVIGKWQYNTTTRKWEEVKRFTYTEPGYVEGMGFGPNDHFWCTTCHTPGGTDSYIYELGNEITRGYPIADAGPDVEAHPPTIPVKFDASGSHHTDPAKKIVLYEWDFESDGIWDYSGTDVVVEHAYPAYYNPDGSIDWDKTTKDYVATLRVTDNSDPPLRDIDTCIVHITPPPWKPVADPNGPYEGFAKVPIQLDGSGSYDPESIMFPEDHPWYETIATYEWDLDYDGEFDDASGPKPTYSWDREGLYIIGLKVTDSQPSGPGGAIGGLDVDIRYTTVVVKPVNVVNIGIVPVNTEDCSIAHSKSYFLKIGEKLTEYYLEVSYHSLITKCYVFEQSEGGWISVPESTKYYAEDKGNNFDIKAEDFINDAIDACEDFVDFSMFDYDVDNGKGIIVLVPAGYSGGGSDSDNFWAAFYYGAQGGHFVRNGIRFDVIIVPEWTFDVKRDFIGALAHEVGHALGELLVTSVSHECKDCVWPLPDLYPESSVSRGNVGRWGLMGSGAWSTYVHLCSFSKEWLGWLVYEKIGGAYTRPIGSVIYEGLGEHQINSLTTMNFKEHIPIFAVKKWYECEEDSYIIEGRTSSSAYSKWDNDVPSTGLVIYYHNKRCLPFTHDTVEFKTVLTEKDDCYSDPYFGITFRFLDTEEAEDNFKISYSIERYGGQKVKGCVLDPSATVFFAVSSVLDSMTPRLTAIPVPDLDLHAYSDDGRHVGLNYETNEFEIEIEGAIVSGDSFNGLEWIFVPEDVNIHYVVSAKDVKNFFDAFPEAQKISNGVETFNLSMVYYDRHGNRWESAPITEEIKPGENIWYVPSIMENPDGTYTPKLSQITWDCVFEDSKRQTVLKISTDDRYFQFITQDKEFLVKQDSDMKVLKRVIVIRYEDWEIKIFTIAVDTKLDFCLAIAWDIQTRKTYFLLDRIGTESKPLTPSFFI